MLYITQPTYFPWIGFFSFIMNCKRVVFLDDVQFVRSKWQQRNKIYNKNTFQYLTVPVIKKGLQNQNLNEVELKDNFFFKEHLKKIKHAYSKAIYFEQIYQELKNLENKILNTNKLCTVNLIIIKKILDLLSIDTKFILSSELDISGKKSEKIKNICITMNYKDLFNNEGSKEYMENDIEIFNKNRINLHFFKYENVKYNQLSKNFINNLSILDLLFNEGTDCKDILSKGLKKII